MINSSAAITANSSDTIQSSRPYSNRAQIIPSHILAVAFVIFTEIMFFSALISAYLVARASTIPWPPEGQPRLPFFETGINTIVLLISGYTMYRCLRELKKNQSWNTISTHWLKITSILSLFFLVGQGREWVRLINFGFKAKTNLYSGHYYSIIGAHGLHVVASVIILLWMSLSRPQYNATRAFSYFWYFVVGLWPILCALVYLI